MLWAILSDVHANLEALEAVLEDLAGFKPDQIDCLGDLVGYGPDPGACIDRIQKTCKIVLCGNHDHAVTHGTLGFSDDARTSLQTTRKLLKPKTLSSRTTRRRWMFLRSLPHTVHREGDLLVHASPRDPLSEYILPDDPMHRPQKLQEIFSLVEQRAFVGHTHMPGIFQPTPTPKFIPQREIGSEAISVIGQKALINVGSVGQPRDQDPRACYLLFDGEMIRFRRVTYDVQGTMKKILANPGLPDRNAERLEFGC